MGCSFIARVAADGGGGGHREVWPSIPLAPLKVAGHGAVQQQCSLASFPRRKGMLRVERLISPSRQYFPSPDARGSYEPPPDGYAMPFWSSDGDVPTWCIHVEYLALRTQ